MIIKNGTVVSATGMKKADIYLEMGRIRSIKKSIKKQGEEVIDATGKFILPGMIDAHVHLRDFKEIFKEDYFSGTTAALAGGVTSVIDMPNNSLPTISKPALEAKKLVASKKALCNYGFHFGSTAENYEEAKKAAEDSSIASLKIYMGSSTGSLLLDEFGAFYHHLSQFHKPITLHAEDENAMRYFSQQFKENDPANHSKIRNEMVAELAIARAISTAERTHSQLHFCHISTEKEISLVEYAGKQGLQVSCEATPHHLFLNESAIKKLKNFAKVNPPLRSKEQVAQLWQALKQNKIDIIASDHAPHLKDEKERSYLGAPAGIPELDTSLLLLLDAVNKKRLSMQQLVRMFSFNPAKIFKIRNKGEIAVGKDADLVIVSMKEKTKIENSMLFTKCKWSPYDGWEVKGKISKTILAGKVAFDGESVLARMGDGKVLRFGT